MKVKIRTLECFGGMTPGGGGEGGARDACGEVEGDEARRLQQW